MGNNIREVVAAIDRLASVQTVDDLTRLQSLVDQYFLCPEAAEFQDVWFRLFERFPDDDGYGVFWTILHAIETQPGSDKAVMVSVRRKPAGFPVRMVNAMLNAGIKSVAGVDLLSLLKEVAADEARSVTLRLATEGYLKHQRECASEEIAPKTAE